MAENSANSQKSFHVELLANELNARKQRNPKYSLRAFSHHLGVDPAALSRILAGKQELSLRSAPKIADALKLEIEVRRKFLDSVVEKLKSRASEFLSASSAPPTERRVLSMIRTPQPIQNSHERVVSAPIVEVIRIDTGRLDEVRRLIQTFAKNLERTLPSSGIAQPVEILLRSG